MSKCDNCLRRCTRLYQQENGESLCRDCTEGETPGEQRGLNHEY